VPYFNLAAYLPETLASLAAQTWRNLEILMLHYKHGYSDVQIATLLGTSRGTIAVTLYRIRARLKRFLESARSNGEHV